MSSEAFPAGASGDRSPILGPPGFAIAVTAADDGVVVRIDGDLDCYSAPQLRAVLLELADGPRRVIVDVSGSNFIDSTGLGVLVGGQKRIREQGGHIVVQSPTPMTTRLFEVTGVSKLFEII